MKLLPNTISHSEHILLFFAARVFFVFFFFLVVIVHWLSEDAADVEVWSRYYWWAKGWGVMLMGRETCVPVIGCLNSASIKTIERHFKNFIRCLSGLFGTWPLGSLQISPLAGLTAELVLYSELEHSGLNVEPLWKNSMKNSRTPPPLCWPVLAFSFPSEYRQMCKYKGE